MSRVPVRPLFLLALLTACADGGADGTDTDTDAAAETDPTSDGSSEGPFSVSVDVSGLDGREVTVILDGDEELEVDEDGEYTFDAELDDGDAFEVTVESDLTCPTVVCRVEDDGEGEIDGDDVTLEVECGRTEVMLVSNDWGVGGLRFVDDLFQYADGDTASSRLVTGEATGIGTGGDLDLDSLAVDPQRDLVYVGSKDTILVFEGIDALEGDVAPVRVITVTGAYQTAGLELDVANDRLYFGDGYAPRYLDEVSTADGEIEAPYLYGKVLPAAITLDAAADRLFVSANNGGTIAVWDDVSTVTEETVPTRVIDWSGGGFGRGTSLVVDPCTDRAYVGSNAPSEDGVYLFVLDDVSTLDGEIVVSEAAAATYTAGQAISLAFDSAGWLYVFEDSATSAKVFTDPASWSGEISDEPDLEIRGAIDRGYGVAVVER